MNNQNIEQDNGISLSDIFRMLRVNWLLILAFTLTATLAAGIFSFGFVANKYKSTSEMMVFIYSTSSNANADPDNPGYDLNASRLFIDTAAGMIKTDFVINKVKEEAANEGGFLIPSTLSNRDIASNISVTSSSTSFIIKVSYSSEDQVFAQNMTDLITTVTVEVLSDDFNGSFMKLTDASEPEDDSPNKILYTFVGAVAGFVLAIGIIFIKNLVRNSYMTKEDLEKGTGVQVLGVIPQFNMKEKK